MRAGLAIPVVLTLILSRLVVGASLAPPPGDETVERFADELLALIGAERRACAEPVQAAVEARRMRAICAGFEGDFDRLRRLSRDLWDREAGAPGADSLRSVVAPETAWTAAGPVRERVYRVGDAAVGVRWLPGEVLVVW